MKHETYTEFVTEFDKEAAKCPTKCVEAISALYNDAYQIITDVIHTADKYKDAIECDLDANTTEAIITQELWLRLTKAREVLAPWSMK